MYRIALFLLLTFPSGFPQADEKPGLSAEFRAKYEGKIVRLKRFCKETTQNFDKNGQLTGSCERGPWTIYGALGLDELRIEGGKLRILAHREIASFEGDALSYVQLEGKDVIVSLSIELERTPSDEVVGQALTMLFVRNSEEFAEYVDPPWARFFSKSENAKPTSTDISVVPHTPTRIRVSSGVSSGLLIRKIQPIYPEIAKRMRRSGTVVMRVLIDREGNVTDISLVRPRGFGWDEAAYEAVREWKYRPYMLNGEPVEVETQVVIVFQLG